MTMMEQLKIATVLIVLTAVVNIKGAANTYDITGFMPGHAADVQTKFNDVPDKSKYLYHYDAIVPVFVQTENVFGNADNIKDQLKKALKTKAEDLKNNPPLNRKRSIDNKAKSPITLELINEALQFLEEYDMVAKTIY